MKPVLSKQKFATILIALLMGVLALSASVSYASNPDVLVSVLKCKKYAPFPKDGHPEVLFIRSHVFDQNSPTVNVIISFHGFEDIVTRPTSVEINQDGFGGAYGNSTDTIMIVPQLKYNEARRAAGKMEEKYGLEKLIIDVFRKEHISGMIGRVTIVAYSGGYWAAIKSAINNPGLDIRNIAFIDTLYWHADDLLDWLGDNGKRRAVVFVSEEKDSVTAKTYFSGTISYFFDAPPTELTEENFFLSTTSLGQLTVVNTKKTHEQIRAIIGPVLGKMKGE